MKVRRFILPVVAMILLASCRSEKDMIPYIHDAQHDSVVTLNGTFGTAIQTNDLLNIYVGSEEPSSTIQFNQETNKIAISPSGVVMNTSTNAQVPGYLVDNKGDIVFPVLGTIHVAGLSYTALATLIEERLKGEGHIRDPRVTVKLMNFHVSVLGEVARPGELVTTGERLTIFEALSMVGDITIYGQRYNVTVVREENGKRVIGQIDLTSKDIFDSPYYYLHQNDVVIVEPNVQRKRAASRHLTWMSYLSTALSAISTVAMAFYYTSIVRK